MYKTILWINACIVVSAQTQSTATENKYSQNLTDEFIKNLDDHNEMSNNLSLHYVNAYDGHFMPLDKQNVGWGCVCVNATTEGSEIDVECTCHGVNLTKIPSRLYQGVQRLTITNAPLTTLKKDALQPYKDSLSDVVLSNLMSLKTIEPGAFRDLTNLRSIYISYSPLLRHLDGLFDDVKSSKFRALRVMHTGLEVIPDLSPLYNSNIVQMIDLEGNKITEVHSNAIRIKAEQVILNFNSITTIHAFAFNQSKIELLSLRGNQYLTHLHEEAFNGIKNIIELEASGTSITRLPISGLEGLEILRIQDTPTLKVIPSIYDLKHLRQAWLTHSFHCCAFKFPARHDPFRHNKYLKDMEHSQKECKISPTPDIGQDGIWEEMGDMREMTFVKRRRRRKRHFLEIIAEQNQNKQKITRTDTASTVKTRIISNGRFWSDPISFEQGFRSDDPYAMSSTHENSSQESSEEVQRMHTVIPVIGPSNPIRGTPFGHIVASDPSMSHIASNNLGVFHQTTAVFTSSDAVLCGNVSANKLHDVKCFPEPDELNPCEDIMGSYWLRISVWIVLITAVIGNMAVIIVLFSNFVDVTVPKFLMCHLAFADLCMGLYLLLVASMDVHSMGVYFNFAYDWQYGVGCQVAGFLTVFASQLSIFTLTIVTLERWFAITHAMYLNRRIKLGMATKIMAVGWIYSIFMASLPLCGISNYSSTSICLPMETRDYFDKVYLTSLLVINGLAFVVIVICYAQIYLSLNKGTRNSGQQSHFTGTEMTVAKKMALLVFTDFACWAPIAFFGLTALAGFPLIDVTRSKILLVFFYPLNSCANPYLYAILTSQYKRDFFDLLSKCGLCAKRAQQYRLTYSLATTNNSNPIPLIIRSPATNDPPSPQKAKQNNNTTCEVYV